MHTKTPWTAEYEDYYGPDAPLIRGADDTIIISGGYNGETQILEADTKYMITAVNNFEEMKAALKSAAETIYAMRNGDPELIPNSDIEAKLRRLLAKLEADHA